MILAILQDISAAETLLNNLSEADFNLEDVSVIVNDAKLRDAIAKDTGPLKGASSQTAIKMLIKLGVSQANAELCQDALLKSKVLVAMDIAPELIQVAEEMFRDHSAQIVKG